MAPDLLRSRNKTFPYFLQPDTFLQPNEGKALVEALARGSNTTPEILEKELDEGRVISFEWDESENSQS